MLENTLKSWREVIDRDFPDADIDGAIQQLGKYGSVRVYTTGEFRYECERELSTPLP